MGYDPRPQLRGMGTYRWYDLPQLKGPRHLWNHRSNWPPPSGNTLIVYKDGTVIEGDNFGPDVMADPDIHRVFVGGYDHRCNSEEDPLSFAALKANGYKCVVPPGDVYPVDDAYSDEYPIKEMP